MKNKKFWSLGLMLVLVLSTVLAACGGEDKKEGTGTDKKSNEFKYFSLRSRRGLSST